MAESSPTKPVGLRAALEKINNAVSDFSSLEVITFRGDITAQINPDNENDPLDWKGLMKKAKASGEVKIALATLVNFDADVQNFVSDEDQPQWLIDAHHAAVKSGLESRKAIFDLFGDVVKSVVKL